MSSPWQDWHHRMKEKYAHAARYPWLRVADDPVPPLPEVPVPVDWNQVKAKILAEQARRQQSEPE